MLISLGFIIIILAVFVYIWSHYADRRGDTMLSYVLALSGSVMSLVGLLLIVLGSK